MFKLHGAGEGDGVLSYCHWDPLKEEHSTSGLPVVWKNGEVFERYFFYALSKSCMMSAKMKTWKKEDMLKAIETIILLY